MTNERVFIENQKYKEFHNMNVGIDYIEWKNGDRGYIYFEEDYIGNRSEAFYKTIEKALFEFNGASDYFREKD